MTADKEHCRLQTFDGTLVRRATKNGHVVLHSLASVGYGNGLELVLHAVTTFSINTPRRQ